MASFTTAARGGHFERLQGTAAVLAFLVDHPEFVQSLVLLEPAIPGYTQNSVPPEAASALAKAAESGDVAGALDIFMGDVAGQPEWRTRFPGTVIQQTEKDAFAFFTWEGPAIGAWMAQQPRGAQQEVPVLYVSGTRSPVPRAYVDFVREWFPDTETLVIQGVSHGLHAEDPQSTAEGVASFLREH